jgi:hypothetical protein
LSSLRKECPLVENPLIANSRALVGFSKQALYLKVFGREPKRNDNMLPVFKKPTFIFKDKAAYFGIFKGTGREHFNSVS